MTRAGHRPVLTRIAEARTRLVRDAALRPGARVVVLCAGEGAETALALEAVGPTGEVAAIDADQAALQALLAATGGAPGLSCVHGDAVTALAASRDLDACICCFGTHYLGVDEPTLAWLVGSRLRPGGVLARLDWLAWGPAPLRERVAQAALAAAGTDLAGTPLPWNEAPLFRGGHRRVAWADVEARIHEVEVTHADAEHFWLAEQATGAWIPLRRRLGPLAFARLRGAVCAAVGPGPVHQQLRFRATLRRTLAGAPR